VADSVEDTAAQRLTRAAARAMASWRAQTSVVGSGATALDTGYRGGARGEASGRAVGAALSGVARAVGVGRRRLERGHGASGQRLYGAARARSRARGSHVETAR
jgi:hypothetical protein